MQSHRLRRVIAGAVWALRAVHPRMAWIYSGRMRALAGIENH